MRYTAGLDLAQVLSQPRENFLVLALSDFALELLQRKMDDVVVVKVAPALIAEAQPQPVQLVDLLGGEMRRVRPEVLDILLASRRVDFERELRFGRRQALPGEAGQARLLVGRHSGREAQHYSGRLERLSGPQDAIPDIGGRKNGQVGGLSVLLRQIEGPREEFLLLEGEELLGREVVLTRPSPPEHADVEHDHVLTLRIDPLKDRLEVVKGVVIPHHDRDVPGTNAQHRRGNLFGGLQMELVELGVGRAALLGDSF